MEQGTLGGRPSQAAAVATIQHRWDHALTGLTRVKVVAPAPRIQIEPVAAPTVTVAIPCFQAATTRMRVLHSASNCSAPRGDRLRRRLNDNAEGALVPYREEITLIRKANGGVASARNALVGAASGEFVATLDADDTYSGRSRGSRLRGPTVDIVTTDGWMEREGKHKILFELDPFAAADQRLAILDRCFFGSWPAVRRSRILRGCYNERLSIGEDWDLWIRLLSTGSAVGMVDEPLMTYRRTSTSLTGDLLADLAARVDVLARSRRLAGMTPGERNALEDSIKANRRWYAVQLIAASIAQGDRWGMVRSATTRGAPLRSRLSAARAAVAPAPSR